MKLAFVSPRYGVDAAGGAEIYTRLLAERLLKEGCGVEVFTTCARDHFSWENYYSTGAEFMDGITVRRFPVDRRNTANFLKVQHKIMSGWKVSAEEQAYWANESVNSRKMYDYIDRNRGSYDFFIFTPYMFGTTIKGSEVCPEKTIIVPRLHDEVYAYLDIFKKMFERARGIIFLTYPEMELGRKLFSLGEDRFAVTGEGFEEFRGVSAERFRKRYDIEGDFCLYAGRREGGKNTPLLVDYFDAYKRHNKSALKLVFIGSGELNIPEGQSDIIDLGFVSVEDKNDAHAAAAFLCQPSVNESFSIIIMDSWLAGVPVLVNSRCNVTSYHCRMSNGGLYFKDYLEFEECVNYFLENPAAAARMGANGKRYVLENYSWEKVIDRFKRAIAKFSG